jgi:hypothetical protein
MSLFEQLAAAAGLDHRIGLARIDAALRDAIVRAVLAGEGAEAIVTSLHRPTVPDGFSMRPLSTADVRAYVAFVQQCRLELRALDRESNALVVRRAHLAELLGAQT